MLELDGIQGLLLNHPPSSCGRYCFLSFRPPDRGRAFLSRIVDQVRTAQPESEPSASCVYVAFTYNGLHALGIDQAALSTFPEEFQMGMPARAEVLGDHGASHPDQWEGGLASSDLHAVLLLFARDRASCERRIEEDQAILATSSDVSVLSTLDVALPATGRVHLGYRDGISQVYVQGAGIEPPPGSGPLVKPGEFVLGYPDETGFTPALPQPQWLSRNGSFLAYRRLYEHVTAFRDFLRQQASGCDEQELLAAKLMGRWRSGAPLVLAPEQDDLELAADPQRNNHFNYGQMDPRGLACPIGAHIRRVNPRDTINDIQRRRLIRRGLPYGPPLPEDAPDDGRDRGGALIFGCASLSRQFEFVQRVWINDPQFQELGHDKDPIVGDHDGTYDMTIQKRPIKKKIHGLPRFTIVKGGAYFFLPGLQALRLLAGA